MRKLSKALRVDLLRSVFSRFFLLSIGLMLAWLMLCGWTYYTSDYAIRYGSVQLLLNDTLIEGSGFLYLLPAVAASGYGWSYCTDYNSKFSLEAQSRVGMWAYSVSKVISVALAAFLASALAMGIYVLFLCTLGMKPPVREDAWGVVAYMGLVAKGQDLLYYLARFLITGLTCSFWAVTALTASAYIPNRYVILFVPVILRYGADVLASMFPLPRIISIGLITVAQPFDDDILSLLWSVEYLLLLIVLCGWLFCRRLRKERGQ